MTTQFKVILVVVALVIIGIVFWVSTSSPDVTPRTEEELNIFEEGNDVTVRGVVSAVDREQMMVDGPGLITVVTDADAQHVIAVPSMGRNLCAAGDRVTDAYEIEPGDLVEVRGTIGVDMMIIPCEKSGHYLRVTSVYSNADHGFSFTYNKGPSGYVLEEPQALLGGTPARLAAVMLTATREHGMGGVADTPREGPPTMQVHVYRNADGLSSKAWAEQHADASGYGRAITPVSETVVSGVEAIQYVSDGLYTADTYVVAHEGYVYVLMGMWADEESPLRADFASIVASFTFFSLPVPM